MSTPIENNTAGLQEILRTVNALPTAESGGGSSGGSSGIPVIDCRELGFSNFSSSSAYNETVTINQTTYNELKTKLESGIVKLTMLFMGGPLTIGLCTGIWDGAGSTAGMSLYNATGVDYTKKTYVFTIAYTSGTYTANLTVG